MDGFQEYLTLSEWMSKVRDEVNDKFYIDVTDKAIIHILKRYEELKKEMEEQ
jgi:hypothetical protein